MLVETIDYKKAYEELQAKVALLSAELNSLQQQLNFYKNARYGRKTEQILPANQLTFFDSVNEAEMTADFEVPELDDIETTEKITYTRKKSKGKRDRDLSGLPTEQVVVEPESTNCPKCDDEMVEIDRVVIRRELEYVPAQYKVIEYVAPKFACINEDCEKTVIQGTLSSEQKPLIDKSLATPSIVAHIINQKYSLSIPLARQELEFAREGITISRQTMANWIMYSAEYLEKIIETLHAELVTRPIIHADETPLQVVIHDRTNGIAEDKNGYVWVYRTGADTDAPIVLFDFGDGRKHINPINFLKGFTGTCHCDGYS